MNEQSYRFRQSPKLVKADRAPIWVVVERPCHHCGDDLVNISESTRASNFNVCHSIPIDTFYISIENDVISYFWSAANRINVFMVRRNAVAFRSIFTLDDVRNAVARLKAHKQQGCGELTSDHILHAGDDFLQLVAHLFTASCFSWYICWWFTQYNE